MPMKRKPGRPRLGKNVRRVLSVRIPPALWNSLKKAAARNVRSVSGEVVKRLVTSFHA